MIRTTEQITDVSRGNIAALVVIEQRQGRRNDGLDPPSAHEALRATRVTREGLGADDVLRSVPTKRQRDRDRHARRRQSIQRQVGKLSRQGKRKPACLAVGH